MYELSIVLMTIVYLIGGALVSACYKDPDMKWFTFIFWWLMVVYYILFETVKQIRHGIIWIFKQIS